MAAQVSLERRCCDLLAALGILVAREKEGSSAAFWKGLENPLIDAKEDAFGGYPGTTQQQLIDAPLSYDGESGADDDDDFAHDQKLSESVWYKLAWFLLSPRKGLAVLVATCALAAPVCSYCLSVETTISFDMSVPSDSDAFSTFQNVENNFGAGGMLNIR